jgi:pilus assembly protein Flp/PilA
MGLSFPNVYKRRGKMKNILMRLWKEEEGQDLIEYALLVALIALGVAAVFPKLAAAIVLTFSDATACMNAPSSTTCVVP